jgi:RHS repeat-associated protein
MEQGYDAEGRICAVYSNPVLGASSMTGYLYDADGTRVAKGSISAWSCDPTANGFQTTNDYILGLGGEQLTEMGMGGTITTTNGTTTTTTGLVWQHANIWAGGKLLGTYDKDGLHFYLDDPLGTRRAQTDAAGVLEQTCSSLPFGDGLACSGGDLLAPTENHFTGKERDVESGNDYFEARYYNSAMGRFMSPDWSAKEEPIPYAKLYDPQTLNLYVYVRNNPMRGVDADGHGEKDGDQSSGGQSDANDKIGKVESYLSGKMIDKVNDKINDKVPGYSNVKDAYDFAGKLTGEYRELYQWVKLRDKAGEARMKAKGDFFDFQTAMYNYADAQAQYHAYKLGVTISSIESKSYINPISRLLGEINNLVTGFPEGQYLRNIEQTRSELRSAFDAVTNEMVRNNSSPFGATYYRQNPVWGGWDIVGYTYPKLPW